MQRLRDLMRAYLVIGMYTNPDFPPSAGNYLNFDLAWPSSSIPDDFFPSNESFYGYKVRHLSHSHVHEALTPLQDFGVWNISYQSVDCIDDWAGGKNAAALGSVPSLEDGACCPNNPTVSSIFHPGRFPFPDFSQGNTNDTCPSYSDANGIP